MKINIVYQHPQSAAAAYRRLQKIMPEPCEIILRRTGNQLMDSVEAMRVAKIVRHGCQLTIVGDKQASVLPSCVDLSCNAAEIIVDDTEERKAEAMLAAVPW